MADRGAKLRKIIRSRFFVLSLTIGLVLFLVGFIKVFWHDWQIRKEISQLEMTKLQLEQKKIQILDYLKKAESTDYAEKEARLHYGLAKPGETLIIINNETNKVSSTYAKSKNFNQEETNWGRWWQYFFKKN